MNDYGWWGETGGDNERHDYRERGAYDRILSAIYQKGKAAAKDWKQRRDPKNPYTRSDYFAIWELGFFNGYENAWNEDEK